jgi:hypothetical protein
VPILPRLFRDAAVMASAVTANGVVGRALAFSPKLVEVRRGNTLSGTELLNGVGGGVGQSGLREQRELTAKTAAGALSFPGRRQCHQDGDTERQTITVDGDTADREGRGKYFDRRCVPSTPGPLK